MKLDIWTVYIFLSIACIFNSIGIVIVYFMCRKK